MVLYCGVADVLLFFLPAGFADGAVSDVPGELPCTLPPGALTSGPAGVLGAGDGAVGVGAACSGNVPGATGASGAPGDGGATAAGGATGAAGAAGVGGACARAMPPAKTPAIRKVWGSESLVTGYLRYSGAC